MVHIVVFLTFNAWFIVFAMIILLNGKFVLCINISVTECLVAHQDVLAGGADRTSVTRGCCPLCLAVCVHCASFSVSYDSEGSANRQDRQRKP